MVFSRLHAMTASAHKSMIPEHGSSFSGVQKVRHHKALDKTEQCCGVSLPKLTEEAWQMNPDGRPTIYQPECRKLAQDYCLLVATNEDLATFSEVTRPHYRMPQRVEDRYHRAAFSARHSCPHLLAAQQAVPELEPQGRGLTGGAGYRGPARNCRRRRVPRRE
jgi:hypothetical protein